ncbi:MAG: hypothetical protein ACJ8BF_09050, partial [Gemmatimonadales bacterium]
MRPPSTARLASLALSLGLLNCRDAPSRVSVSSAGAQASPGVVEAQRAVNTSRRTALVAAADRVSPAVVSINVTSRQQTAPETPWDF